MIILHIHCHPINIERWIVSQVAFRFYHLKQLDILTLYLVDVAIPSVLISVHRLAYELNVQRDLIMLIEMSTSLQLSFVSVITGLHWLALAYPVLKKAGVSCCTWGGGIIDLDLVYRSLFLGEIFSFRRLKVHVGNRLAH